MGRVLPTLLIAALAACSADEIRSIRGTATLPDCSDPPLTSLDGTHWYDNGTVTILSAGCPETGVGDTFTACALDWIVSQRGNDVEIIVDDEYRLEGRLCGETLHLQGGWWLPVMDPERASCTYDDDSAEEVAIQAGGSTLAVSAQQMSGTLAVQGRCSARYDVTFHRK